MTQRTFRAVLRSIEHPLLPRLLVLVGIPVACPLPPGAGKVDSAEGMATLEAMSSHHNFRQGTRAKICWFQFCSSPPSIQHQFPSIASGRRIVAFAVPAARNSAATPVMRMWVFILDLGFGLRLIVDGLVRFAINCRQRSSFAHHLLQSNTNSQALPLAGA